MTRFLAALLCLGLAGPVAAQDPMPERRAVITRDMDFYGGDLQPLFDTDAEACQRICLNDPACAAFTYNGRNGSCFPKTGISDRVPYAGALSGEVVKPGPAVVAGAAARAADLGFLDPADLAAARDEALALALRHGGGDWTVDALAEAAQAAEAAGDIAAALDHTGAALAQEDGAALWLRYGRLAGDMAAARDRDWELRQRVLPAAINAYLRAETVPEQVGALRAMARALEDADRGRAMIPALRLAERLAPGAEVTRALDAAIAAHGFRITDTRVESDSAAPRICAEFSEPLRPRGQDYAPFVARPDPRLVVQPAETAICIDGVAHGARYTVTFREGLPAASGEVLARDVPVTLYVRDRAPSVGFPGRAYVLPPSPGAGLPVETVNTDALDLTLRRVADRNILRALQEDHIGRPLSPWMLDRLTGEVAEVVWTGSAAVESELNTDRTARLPLGDAIGGRAPGLYALTATVPGRAEEERGSATQWFVLSDIGLVSYAGSDGLTVLARRLSDAAPMAGVTVTLLSRSNRELGAAATDAEGVARFAPGLLEGSDGGEPALLTAAAGDDDLTFLSLSEPAFDLSDRGVAGREPAGPLDAFLATDRGAYRAGETVRATVLLRDAAAAAVPGVPVTAVLSRPDGVTHDSRVSQGAGGGGHVFGFDLATTVPRGTWRLSAHADPAAPPLASVPILVEDFVPERIDFELSLPEGPIRPGAPPSLTVEARYLFGAPGAGLDVEGELRLSPAKEVPGAPGWRFGRHDEVPDPAVDALAAGVETDAEGRATLPLILPEPGMPGRPYTAEVTLRLSEGSGRPVERRISRPVAPDAPMIGIAPLFDDVLAEGAEAAFRVQGFGADLSAMPMDVTWEVNRLDTRYQWYESYGQWLWEPVTRRERVAAGELALADGPGRIDVPVGWGEYELVVERADGAYVASSVGFSAGWFAPAEAADSPDLLDLSLDRAAYRPGDTARLRLVPRGPGTALISVLTDRVVAMQTVTLDGEATEIDLPVTADWGAGAYVTAQVIRPAGDAEDRRPVRALGLAHASVDPGDRRLSVSIDAPAETAPRAPLEAVLRVDGLSDGAPVWATLAAVDVGVLNLTGFTPPDPAAHYFGQRRLGVEIRDLYGRLIDGQAGTPAQVRSGGDAMGQMALDGPPPTEAVVALFSGPLAIGPDGTAQARFDLPDFNGTVKLMAVAWSAEGVGSAARDVLVRDPVVVSASLPRFLSPGDAAELRLELTHARGPAGEVAVAVDAPGLALDASALPETVTLAEGGRAVVTLPLTAREPGDHAIEVALTAPGGARLTKTLTLGVRRTDPDVAETRRLVLAPGETFTLDDALMAGFAPESAEVLVSAGPMAKFDAAGLLARLSSYPYGCTEQIASQTLPLLALSDAAESLYSGGAPAIRAAIGDGISRMLTRQAANGAFGLWQADAGEPWLDAYVTDILSRARAAGYEVPETAFGMALDNLANRIAYAPDIDAGGGADIAYALLVLAREGRAAIGDLRYYADTKADDFATPMALAQLGAALAQMGEQARADRMFRAAAARLASQTPRRELRADFGTPWRDTAALVTLAAESGSAAVAVAPLADRLAAPEGRLSTQEQAWALMAARALAGEASGDLRVDGAPVEGPWLERRAAGAPPQVLSVAGDAPLPLTLTTRGVPDAPRPAGGYGYAIERDYFTREGEPVDIHAAPLAQGTRLIAVLTVRPAEATGARLMIDDALPAGFEIDNPALLRGGEVAALDWLETAEPEHVEFRTERFLAAITWQGTQPIRLAYSVRAVSPGAFHHPAATVEDMYRPDYRAQTDAARIAVAR